jgi:hypothetical protein
MAKGNLILRKSLMRKTIRGLRSYLNQMFLRVMQEALMMNITERRMETMVKNLSIKANKEKIMMNMW